MQQLDHRRVLTRRHLSVCLVGTRCHQSEPALFDSVVGSLLNLSPVTSLMPNVVDATDFNLETKRDLARTNAGSHLLCDEVQVPICAVAEPLIGGRASRLPEGAGKARTSWILKM